MPPFGDDEDGFWAARLALTPDELEHLKAVAADRARQAYDATTRALAKTGDAASRAVADATGGVDKFKAGVQAQMQDLMGQRAAAARSQTPNLPLRGPLPAPAPSRAPQRSRSSSNGGYAADLSNPSKVPFMTTCADADCRHSYIDPYPAAGLGRNTRYPELRAGVARLAAGEPVDPGPKITFRNNVANGPSTHRPLTTDTARMVAAGFLQSGAHAMNVSSTTGGLHGDRSLHYSDQAADINTIDGRPVSLRNPHRELQDIFAAQPNIGEDLGPSYLMDNKKNKHALFRDRALEAIHAGHIHVAGNE